MMNNSDPTKVGTAILEVVVYQLKANDPPKDRIIGLN
jgi:hypothetical protein